MQLCLGPVIFCYCLKIHLTLCMQHRVCEMRAAAGFGSLLLQQAAGWGRRVCGSRAPVLLGCQLWEQQPQSCRDPAFARGSWNHEAVGRLRGGCCPAPGCSSYLGGEREFCSAAVRSRRGHGLFRKCCVSIWKTKLSWDFCPVGFVPTWGETRS